MKSIILRNWFNFISHEFVEEQNLKRNHSKNKVSLLGCKTSFVTPETTYFSAVFQNQITFVRIRTEIHTTTFAWV